MPCVARFNSLVGGLLALFALTAAAEERKPDPSLDIYATPGELVDIGAGRNLNLRCSGSGTPTVILESGNNADSMTWSKVQPGVAKFARVCAYDRAGTGFSDGGPLPRTLDANADDLYALIRAAHVALPVVLVGHSYGTNVVRRVADRHARSVAALVLLDPPPQHVSEFAPDFDKLEAEDRAATLKVYRQCEAAAEKGEIDVPSAQTAQCLRGPNPAYSAELNAALHASKVRPAFWHTVISISENNGALYAQPVPKTETHGATPLLILQPDAPFADAPPEIGKPLEAARQKTQRAIAATSTQGSIIPVARSSHDVQLDRPDAVIDAIGAAIRRVDTEHARKSASG